MRKSCFLLLFCCFTFSICAQYPQQEKTGDATFDAITATQLSYYEKSSFDSALIHAHRALSYATSTGKKILEAIEKSAGLKKAHLQYSHDILNDYGNMSSPTVLFVLEKILAEVRTGRDHDPLVFGAAFGPGLTMETFTASYG